MVIRQLLTPEAIRRAREASYHNLQKSLKKVFGKNRNRIKFTLKFPTKGIDHLQNYP
jgi:hypothetical protein